MQAMGQSRRPRAVNVESAAEGIRTAAKLVRLKIEILSGEGSPGLETSAVIQAFTTFAEELDGIAQHLAELGSPESRAQ